MIIYVRKKTIFGKVTHQVFLDKKLVGEIRELEAGFQYFPRGRKDGGEVYRTLADCKASLES